MPKYILYFYLIISLLSCKKDKETVIIPKEIKGFHIYGTIPSFEGKTIYLQKRDFDKNYNTIQEFTVNQNKFEFIGNANQVDLYYLGFKDFDYKIPVIINNFETIVHINPTDIDKSEIKGSTLQEEYIQYLKGVKKAKNKFLFKTKWIKKNSNSPLAVIVLSEMLGKNKWRLEQNKNAFETLSKANQNSTLGIAINKFLEVYLPKAEKQDNIAEFSLNPEIDNNTPIKNVIVPKPKKVKKIPNRKKAPNFYAESLNGNDISLNEVRKGAKITLIDFWASWCAPCRASNPHLVKLYNKYHKSGFNIISVSEDDINKKHLWKNAITQDGLIWKHVIDDDARVATMFGVRGIPHTVLLDANGGIIFVKKTPFTIEKKLKEVFGY